MLEDMPRIYSAPQTGVSSGRAHQSPPSSPGLQQRAASCSTGPQTGRHKARYKARFVGSLTDSRESSLRVSVRVGKATGARWTGRAARERLYR